VQPCAHLMIQEKEKKIRENKIIWYWIYLYLCISRRIVINIKTFTISTNPAYHVQKHSISTIKVSIKRYFLSTFISRKYLMSLKVHFNYRYNTNNHHLTNQVSSSSIFYFIWYLFFFFVTEITSSFLPRNLMIMNTFRINQNKHQQRMTM
jgi:hypothetical protein